MKKEYPYIKKIGNKWFVFKTSWNFSSHNTYYQARNQLFLINSNNSLEQYVFMRLSTETDDEFRQRIQRATNILSV